MIRKIYNFALNVVFPVYCCTCGNVTDLNENFICSNCISSISPIESFCLKCGQITDNTAKFCSQCVDKNVYYERLFSVCKYEQAVLKFLRIIKFQPSSEVLENLEFLYNIFSSDISVLEDIKKISFDIDYICPVPIHSSRIKLRGYNQSDLIADIVSNTFNIRVKKDLLVKVKNTNFFYGLNVKERKKELSGAFKISNKKDLHGKNILLLDDIATTGTTFNNIAKLLLDNGANTVFALCLTKA